MGLVIFCWYLAFKILHYEFNTMLIVACEFVNEKTTVRARMKTEPLTSLTTEI